MISDNFKKRIITSITLFFLTFLIFNNNLILVYSLIIFGILSFLEFSLIINKITLNKVKKFLSNIFFIFYLFSFYSTLTLLISSPQFKIIIFFLLLGCITSDIGGFIVGKIFKGQKLTKISPNKTVSGSIGALLLTIIVMSLTFFYFFKTLKIEIIFLALITSFTCQVGDLFFSYLKRKAKLKDTGSFLPGHGGVLDRLDGIYLAMPVGLISFFIIF